MSTGIEVFGGGCRFLYLTNVFLTFAFDFSLLLLSLAPKILQNRNAPMNTRLRSVLMTASIVLAGFGAITYTACKEDKCKAIVCANGSVCKDGACICPSGYEGAQCETVNRERFLGNWSVVEDGTISASVNYNVTVKAGSAITEITIQNFRNYYTNDVIARVKGDTLYIDPQVVPAGGGATSTITGKGYLTRDIYYGEHAALILRYSAVTNGITDDYGSDENNPGSFPSRWHK
jgi:hypothetical protein